MIAVGVDVHKRQCSLAMQFKDGELASFAPFENTRAGWQELLAALPSETLLLAEEGIKGWSQSTHGRKALPWLRA